MHICISLTPVGAKEKQNTKTPTVCKKTDITAKCCKINR